MKKVKDRSTAIGFTAIAAASRAAIPDDVLRNIASAEKAYRESGGLAGDYREAAARLAAIPGVDILASPSLRHWIHTWRRIIQNEPAHAHTIIGKKLRAILSALMPPGPGKRKFPPPTKGQMLHGKALLQVHAEFVSLVRRAVGWAGKTGKDVVETANFSRTSPPAAYVGGSKNWYGEEVEPFAASLAKATNVVLAGRGRRTGLRPEVAAAIWLYAFEFASVASRADAMAWLRRVRARVSWQRRRYAVK